MTLDQQLATLTRKADKAARTEAYSAMIAGTTKYIQAMNSIEEHYHLARLEVLDGLVLDRLPDRALNVLRALEDLR